LIVDDQVLKRLATVDCVIDYVGVPNVFKGIPQAQAIREEGSQYPVFLPNADTHHLYVLPVRVVLFARAGAVW
jgi:hypothetical protein